jgi:predicted aldo/keto reductase-like oxidoreductase
MMIQGHIGSTDINEQYDQSRDLPTCKKYFENLLRALNTDYIDFGMLFYIDTEKDFNDMFGDILAYAQNLKKQGTIRAIGASSHNPRIARRVVETGAVDLLLFSINPAFDMASADTYVLDYLGDAPLDFEKQLDGDRANLYRICEQRGVAITVMKTLGAGKLLSKEFTPFEKPLTVGQCIHYALTRPAVVSALVGCKSGAEVREAVGYLDMSDEERDYSAIVEKYQGSFRGSCVYCSHCLPCPSEIDIASVNKYLDIALLGTTPPGVAQHYRALSRHGSDCVACGSCETKCPFSVPVMKNMERAAAVFGV